MATGPNQILIKRSDTASNEPSGLSYGEPAINTADGVLYFAQQTNGIPSGDFWEFHGFTNEGFVRSVNGQTGDITDIGGGLDAVAVSGGSVVTGPSSIEFASLTDGLTFAVSLSGATATVTLDATSIANRIGDGSIKYTYSVTSGVLNLPNATSNGEFIYNPDITNSSYNNISIYKFGNDGEDYRDVLSKAATIGNGAIGIVIGDTVNERYFYYTNASYDGTNFDAFIHDTFPDSVTAGNGKTISVYAYPNESRVGATEHFRFPDGTTASSIVTSFNGETGDVIGVSSVNGQTGDVTLADLVGVNTFSGFSGDVAVGITTGQILFHGTTDITGSNNLLWDNTNNILTIGNDGYFDGRQQGSNIFLIKADEPISAGDPVYITGTVGASARVTVARADASDPAKMPAAGVAYEDLDTNEQGEAVVVGTINYDTTGLLVPNASLYVAAGGGLTAARPTDAGVLIQNMARVKREDKSNGSLIVAGAFRTNDVPNALIVYDYLQMPDGFTTDSVVGSVNGMTGDVIINGFTAGNTAPASANTGDFWFETDTSLLYSYVWDGVTLSWVQLSGRDGATGPQGSTGAAGESVGYTAGNTAPTGSNTGDFWYETDTGLYYAYVWDGSTLGWLQISGQDGAAGATGATGPVGDYVESFNGATGAVEGVSSVNGATGAVQGVSSVNGATGDVVTPKDVVMRFPIWNLAALSGDYVARGHKVTQDLQLVKTEIYVPAGLASGSGQNVTISLKKTTTLADSVANIDSGATTLDTISLTPPKVGTNYFKTQTTAAGVTCADGEYIYLSIDTNSASATDIEAYMVWQPV